jgi:alpha-L-fucosidase
MKITAPSVTLCVLTSIFLLPPAGLGQAQAAEDSLGAPAESIQAWRQRRFGMFIHWGPVSLKGTEIGWSRGGERRGHRSGHGTQVPVEVYDNLYKQFDPVNFDADQWVQIAQEAGMKYLVFTSKHHDGFCNFDSKLTDYKITNPQSPYGRDICAQLAAACHRADLPLGWYYSPPDWHHPDYRNGQRHARYIEYLHGQVREILSNYGKVDIMWFDGLGGSADDWDSPTMFRLIRQLQPNIVINNRGGLPADHDTPEQRIGGFNRQRPWETCMTICRQWAWKPDDLMKSRQQCLQTLLQVVGGDGNLLFNVGPMPDGRIEPRQVERLKQMGQWLAEYGDGVYGTRGGPFKPGRWGASTCKDNKIYLYVMRWPADGPLQLPPIDLPLTASRTRSGGEARIKASPEGITIRMDEQERDEVATVIELTVAGPAFDIPPVSVNVGSPSAALGKPAQASNVFQNQATYGPDKAVDGDPDTRWATDGGTHQAWLEIDLGQPTVLDRVRIDEALEERVEEFQVRCGDGPTWDTVIAGTTIGRDFEKKFSPVTARRVRLEILQATEGPTIWEFQVAGPATK